MFSLVWLLFFKVKTEKHNSIVRCPFSLFSLSFFITSDKFWTSVVFAFEAQFDDPLDLKNIKISFVNVEASFAVIDTEVIATFLKFFKFVKNEVVGMFGGEAAFFSRIGMFGIQEISIQLPDLVANFFCIEHISVVCGCLLSDGAHWY